MAISKGENSDLADQSGMIKLAVYNIQKEVRIYHVGVLANGREFHYGMRIGVFSCEPMNQRKTFHVKYWRKMVKWRIEFMRYVQMLKAFPLQTNLTLEQLEKVQRELGEKYTRQNYHLINHNCIDFAREFIRRIAAKQPPNGCWPQEIRQPRIILPLRLIWRIEERKELRKEKQRLEGEGQIDGMPTKTTVQLQPILHIISIKIQPTIFE